MLCKIAGAIFFSFLFFLTTSCLVLQQLLWLFLKNKNNFHILSNLTLPLLSYYPSHQYFFSVHCNSLLTFLLPFLYLPSRSVSCENQRSILNTLIRSGHFYAQNLPMASKVFSFSASLPGILSQTLVGLILSIAFLEATSSDHPM